MKNDLIKNRDGVKIIGTITVRAYKAGTKELVKEIVTKNTIMKGNNIGMDLLVQKLIGTNTYSGNINYGAIGNSSTVVVAVSDTQLAAEVARTTVAYSADLTNNEAQLQFFFPDAQLSNQTYYEFGTFVDGTASANSGQLFNHAKFSSSYTKAGGTDTTVEVDITFS